MKISKLLQTKATLSFEIFPPKQDSSPQRIGILLEQLHKLNPDFISVTCGAGGSGNGHTTGEIATAIQTQYDRQSLVHLPCIGLNENQVRSQLEQFKKQGIENILALRGDIPEPGQFRGDFPFASDLISFIRKQGDFDITAACYPEGHIESKTLEAEMQNLKRKVDAGANQLITQLFFDNTYFYRFQEHCLAAGIQVPVVAGIMPMVNKRQVQRMLPLCQVTLPKKFITTMDRYQDHPEALRDAGIAYAIDQITDLLAQGVRGIHLYTMNNPNITEKIYAAVHRLMAA